MANRLAQRGRTITDHRGRIMSLDRPPLVEVKTELQPEVAKRVDRFVKRGYFGRHGWRAIALLALVAALSYMAIELSPHIVALLGGQRMGGWWGWLLPAAYGVLLGLIVWGALALEGRCAARRLWTALLRERHCPRCLYSLKGLREEDDGCVICPECGAAWRLDSTPREQVITTVDRVRKTSA